MFSAFLKVFGSVFVAEIGDKTSLATMGFAATMSKWTVFTASSLALVAATLIGTLIGGWFGKHVPAHYVDVAAGVLFVGIGLWKLIPALKIAFA